MTLMDPKPGFHGHIIFEVEYLKKVRFRDKFTIEHE